MVCVQCSLLSTARAVKTILPTPFTTVWNGNSSPCSIVHTSFPEAAPLPATSVPNLLPFTFSASATIQFSWLFHRGVCVCVSKNFPEFRLLIGNWDDWIWGFSHSCLCSGFIPKGWNSKATFSRFPSSSLPVTSGPLRDSAFQAQAVLIKVLPEGMQ